MFIAYVLHSGCLHSLAKSLVWSLDDKSGILECRRRVQMFANICLGFWVSKVRLA